MRKGLLIGALLLLPSMASAQWVGGGASSGGGSGTLTSISNSDGTIVLSPSPITTTGTVSVNLANVNTWTGAQTFPSASLTLSELATQGADSLVANATAGSASPTAVNLLSCSAATSALTYNTSTHAFGCNTISGSGTVNTGTTPDIAYYATSAAAVSDGGAVVVTAGGINVASSTAPTNGISLIAANTVGMSASGTNRFEWGPTALFSATATGPQMTFAAPTGTAPSLIPNRNSGTTGVGAQASGNVSLIAGGVEIARFDARGVLMTIGTASIGGTATASCATTCTDGAGTVTAGTTATSVTITFSATKTTAPTCMVGSETQLVAFSYTVSATVITITQTATSGNKIDYVCFQH